MYRKIAAECYGVQEWGVTDEQIKHIKKVLLSLLFGSGVKNEDEAIILGVAVRVIEKGSWGLHETIFTT